MPQTIATRTVTPADQLTFAAYSGDRNPMHMDAVAARRTQAGQPVVHGVQNLLWALESLAAKGLFTGAHLTRIRARFLKWVYVGETVTVRVPTDTPHPASFEIHNNGLTVEAIDLTYGEPQPLAADASLAPSPAAPLAEARVLTLAEMEARTDNVYTATDAQTRELYPALSAAIGTAAVAGIAAASYIVGMETPGLHSMFSKLDVTLHAPTSQHAALGYTVTAADPRFSKLRIALSGAGLRGTLEAFMREPPTEQASLKELSTLITSGEFTGVRALIVGGSRGLGEVAAKLIAAGGGTPIVTYAVGKTDAEKVVASIQADGGSASTIAYDVRKDPATQLAALTSEPTHVLYFATSTIFRPKAGLIAPAMLAEFLHFYVQAFYDLTTALLARRTEADGTLGVLYPSTVFLDERPAGMAEYALMKAAGEQLCQEMNTYLPGLRVIAPRLPKLPTDQTASVLPGEKLIAAEALLPSLRQLTQH